MAKRTLTAHRLRFHVRQHPGDFKRPTDLDGVDLLDAFEAWCRSDIERADDERRSWFDVRDFQRVGKRVTLVKLFAGSWGEPGPLVGS